MRLFRLPLLLLAVGLVHAQEDGTGPTPRSVDAVPPEQQHHHHHHHDDAAAPPPPPPQPPQQPPSAPEPEPMPVVEAKAEPAPQVEGNITTAAKAAEATAPSVNEETDSPFESGLSRVAVPPNGPPPPENEPEVESNTEIAPSAVPEPAIKFDNIQSEDYSDAAEASKQPDALDEGVIDELVNTFLNTGGSGGAKTETKGDPNAPPPEKKKKVLNPAAQALVDSSDYWKTDNLKPEFSISDENEAQKWINGYAAEAQKILQQVTQSGWKYFTNASPTQSSALAEAEEVASRFVRATAKQAKQFDTTAFTDPLLKKQFSYVAFEGMNALPAEDLNAFKQANSRLNKKSAETAICDLGAPPPCTLKRLDLPDIFRLEKDADRLSHLWINYLTNIANLKNSYNQIIQLSNKGAELNGFKNGGAMWFSAYDLSSRSTPPTFDVTQKLNEIYKKITPFYKQLHAYLRRQIAGIYKNPAGLSRDGPIPAHLFGTLEGGDWSEHFGATRPYEEEDTIPEEILNHMSTNNITTAKQMFIKAYRYFKSVGFPPLPKSFWSNSVFTRNWSKDMICDPPAAIDMRDGMDYRVKACAQPGDIGFHQAHALLAQVYYQYLYREQPLTFREAANPSISEAIANVFSIMAANRDYLYSQSLIRPEFLIPKESDIVNRLYKEALTSFAKLPFDIAADQWRLELFEGKTEQNKWNDRWWALREKYEGVRSPQPYNVSNVDALIHSFMAQGHSPAMRGLVTYVAQFQILKALCPEGSILSEGCILSEDTTMNLREAMKMGSSISWLKALEIITGKGELDVQPLLEYFEPLIHWLQNANEVDGVIIGWNGEGIKFNAEEIPKPRGKDTGSSSIISGDRVAYPGDDCTNGQECLLDSMCTGKICECNPGMYTLNLGKTISCVAGNPADSGFGTLNLTETFIGLVPSVTTTSTPAPENVTSPRGRTLRRPSSSTLPAISLLVLLLSFYQ